MPADPCLSAEHAGEHETGDCTVRCTHPDCVWVGAAELTLWDDIETIACEEPLLLWVPTTAPTPALEGV